MSKTMADHARAYRKRKAARIERYESALREIANGTAGEPQMAARTALGEL